MTFGPRHYVPVLKVKRGEKKALRSIASTLRSQITPLLEIVERKSDKAPTVDAHLDTVFRDLFDSVRIYDRCFLDARELAVDGPAAAAAVFRRASEEGIVFTPVTGISRSADVSAALASRANGLALRLTRDEFERGELDGNLQAFIGQHEIVPEETDLIVDLGPVDRLITEGVAALTNGFMGAVSDHQQWRTFTVSGCAFPSSMSVVGRNSHAFVERAEWVAWRDHLHACRDSISRLPTFSDCCIQHPLGVEGFNPRTMQVSASIRYTLPEKWLLIKGESTRIRLPRVQFPELGTRLVYGQFQRHYCGRTHCEGCASMKDAADMAGGFGSAEAWRRLGTVHHITTALEAIGSLSWS